MNKILISLLVIVSFYNTDAQLRTTDETKQVIAMMEAILISYECISNNQKDSEQYDKCLSEIILLEATLDVLVNSERFQSKVQYNKKKLKDLTDKWVVIKQFLAKIDQIEKNKYKWKSYIPGDKICYYIEDQRGGYLMIHLEVESRTPTSLKAKVVGIDDYNPYDNLDHQIRRKNSAVVSNTTYYINESYNFNFSHASNFTNCTVIR